MAGEPTRYRVSELIARGTLALGDGYRAKNSELGDQGLPFARAGNIDGQFLFDGADKIDVANINVVADKISRPNDTVFTSKGTVGRFARVKDETPRFVYSPQLCYWRSLDEKKIDAGYLYYWLSGPEFYSQYKGVSGQTDMAEYVSLGDQRSMWITLPDVSRQRSVANLLGTLDDKIELNRRMTATLEEIARELFKSWFVDFDPIRAKAKGRDPGLPAATAALFPDAFGEDGLPVGWTMKKVADGCRAIFSGGTPSTSEPDFWNGTLPWLSSGETRHRFVTETEKKITQQALDNSSTRFARRGSTVIASAGQGNTRGQTSFLLLDTHINQSVVVLQADTSVASDLFLFFNLERRYDEFRRVSDGQSSRGSLTTKLIGGLPALCPDRKVVAAFDAAAQPLVDRIERVLAETEGLKALRDTLLPKLISGELRIRSTGNSEVEVA